MGRVWSVGKKKRVFSMERKVSMLFVGRKERISFVGRKGCHLRSLGKVRTSFGRDCAE
jgi:hypothetical protein